MTPTDQRKLERERRERKFRIRLTTLSWTMPVVAFGSFFSIWHSISNTVNHPSTSSQKTAPVSVKDIRSSKLDSRKIVTPSVLFKIGSEGPNVSVIQEQLYELGYFNHDITENYGSVTKAAVESFQKHYNLAVTGEVDSATMNALKQAVRTHKIRTLATLTKTEANTQSGQTGSTNGSTSAQSGTSSQSRSSAQTVPSQPSIPPTQSTGTSSVAQSQQSTPITSSSASSP
ncbi:peptidoglycan-binding domain-containing protein [Alicyclobacillus fastidiosus]|uniref:peptidoglycan-binding domain-containing protein n=1 Tax=Alicyclobacillus fastidiosus TaxID=392011 RepID=UPI0024E107DC|nr:peptidoglycan-binding domain-containing protein [Alicyclobacillus fastidiosus]